MLLKKLFGMPRERLTQQVKDQGSEAKFDVGWL